MFLYVGFIPLALEIIFWGGLLSFNDITAVLDNFETNGKKHLTKSSISSFWTQISLTQQNHSWYQGGEWP